MSDTAGRNRSPEPQPDPAIEELLLFIRDSRGFDFTGYKRSSLIRRIRKRMADVGVAGYSDYRDLLETDSDEYRALFNTILINVTSFFRDIEAWKYLQDNVIPDVIADTQPGEEIRVWSAGCSTGQEAYSLAITFAEVIGIEEFVQRVKIYGTDMDEEALREARVGVYSAKALEGLDPELRKKYFDANGMGYMFRSDLRRRVIFGRHDITSDAPISRQNLLVCRNTLMYFNMETQSAILDRFYFALRPRGYLFLGKAEMLLSDGDRFDVASMRQRVFQRRDNENAPLYQRPARLGASAASEVREATRRRQLRDLVFDTSPNSVVVIDADGTVALANSEARIQFGVTNHDIGRPFHDLELSYRPVELRSRIERALRERRVERIPGVERRVGDESVFLDVVVQPLILPEGPVTGVVLIFTDSTLATQLQAEVKRNREDLETAYEELQSTNEELETTNEELQSSIEELETTNEELQSTNEELETTNEELQSTNEELETMNDEMRIRGDELDDTRAFLEKVLTSIAAGVVVLDTKLLIRSWNKGAEELWGLRSDEVIQQPFFGLDFGLPTTEIRAAVQTSLENSERVGPIKVDSINRRGRPIVCAVTCSPLDIRGGGIVLMLEDVTGI